MLSPCPPLSGCRSTHLRGDVLATWLREDRGRPLWEGGGWEGGRAAPLLVLTDRVSAAKAAAMPHFLDWFVPVYLFISVLILVGFGACIYYFEPGLQEAHKWRMQRPLVDRDFRKTLMVRDNLAFGGPEV